MTTADVVLIGCTKLKRAERATARDLYDPSDLFRRRRDYAEGSGKPWAILSAAHGVIEPTFELEPYDFTIGERRRADGHARQWAIGAVQACFRLAGREPSIEFGTPALVVEVHAGIDYVRTLELGTAAFGGIVRLEHPVRGLGIGDQKRHYSHLNANEQASLSLGYDVVVERAS